MSTHIRKLIAGLSMGAGSSGLPVLFDVVKVRPEAALVGGNLSTLVPAAGVSVSTQRGAISVGWRVLRPDLLPPTVFPAPERALPRMCAVLPQFPVPAGGLFNPNTTMELACAPGSTIASVAYAYWGNSDKNKANWFCCGPQPPPVASCSCAHDVSAMVEKQCVGLPSCTLHATTSVFGDPCHLPQGAFYQLAARITCSSMPKSPLHHAAAASAPLHTASAAEPGTTLFSLNVTVPAGSTGEIHVPKVFLKKKKKEIRKRKKKI